MGLEYFPCYHSYIKKCEKLSDQELGRLFRALMQFSATGERQELAGRESIAFDFIADDIARAKEAYDARCRTNAENIAKRYATTEYDGIRPNTTVYESYQSKDKSKDKGKVIITTPNGVVDTPAKKPAPKFVPPTLDEVTAYCLERGNGIDPKLFVDHYSANGWRVGKNPMKDWKAAIRTWEKNEYRSGGAYRAQDTTSFADIYRDLKQKEEAADDDPF